MSNIQIFNFNSNPVRIELFEDQPHFCLLDVCSVFEIQNSRRVQSEMLDPQGVRQAYTLAKDEKQRKISFINEPNLYRIIFRSEKPIAKEFQNWVFEEVLPQIRQTGQYSQNQKQIAPLEKEFHLTHTNDDLKAIAWTWYEAYRMAAFLKRIEPALRALQSPFAAEAYSMGHEYGWHIENTAKLIHRITQGVDYGNRPTPAVHLEKVLKPKPKAVKHYDF